jgi:hypothetical protein
MEGLFLTDYFDIHRILEKLSTVGAASAKILNEGFRKSLLAEAECYTYEPEDEVVGTGDKIVRQQMSSFEDFPEDGKYTLLKQFFQSLIDEFLRQVEPYPFETKLNFNSAVIQKYEKGSIGITPHRDGLSYINLVCLFVIEGRGRFFICSDRSGRDPNEIDASPGNVILMRAPGFLYSKERPFHHVNDIQERRYVFGLRQKRL